MNPKPWEQIPGESLFAHSLFVSWLHCGWSEERLAATHRLSLEHVKDIAKRYGWALRRQHWDLYVAGVGASVVKAQATELAAARARAIEAHARALEVLSSGLEAWAERARISPGVEDERTLVALLRAIPQGLKRLEKPLEQAQGDASGIDPARLSPEELEQLQALLEKATPPT